MYPIPITPTTPGSAKAVPIPAVSTLDFTNSEEIYAWYHLLGSSWQINGGFDFPLRMTPILRSLKAEARQWLAEAERILPSSHLPHVPPLLEAYDLIHRIVHGSPSATLLRDYRIAALHRWLSGDKTITRTQVVKLIDTQLNEDFRAIDINIVRWCIEAKGAWTKELITTGTFTGVSGSELYDRLRIILSDDLYPYLGKDRKQKEIKSQWTQAHLVKDITLLPTPVLISYANFIREATSMLLLDSEATPGESKPGESKTGEAIAELSSRPDLHPYHRRAYLLDLTAINF